jgi:hypothetical protein
MQPMVALRESPSEKSEMINQLLFGDLYGIEETYNGWCLITTIDDDYSAWANILQLHFLARDEFMAIKQKKKYYSLSDNNTAHSKTNDSFVRYTFGSCLPNYSDKYFEIDGTSFEHMGKIISPDSKIKLLDIAKRYLGSPYLWGGRSIFGLDCSGFVQIVFKLKGILLPRDASQQVNIGNTLNFLEEAIDGDLAFFENEEGNIVHVGILIGNDKIIHASGEVKIDSIDHNGIFSKKLDKYTHKLRILKRIS